MSREQRARLADALALVEKLPQDAPDLDADGGIRFSARDFLAQTRLYSMLGGPSLGSLSYPEWRVVHLALHTVVLSGLRLLVEPHDRTKTWEWQVQGNALARYFHGVANGTPTRRAWEAVAREHQRMFGHLPGHSTE